MLERREKLPFEQSRELISAQVVLMLERGRDKGPPSSWSKYPRALARQRTSYHPLLTNANLAPVWQKIAKYLVSCERILLRHGEGE